MIGLANATISEINRFLTQVHFSEHKSLIAPVLCNISNNEVLNLV